MIAAIPKSVLPDSIQVRVPKDSDYGGEYEEPVTIEHIRFDSSKGVIGDRYTFAEGSRGLIFIDALNSPGAFNIPAGSRITYKGENLNVVTVTEYQSFEGRVHHWEVEVA